MGELEEKGFNGDSAEAALLTHDKDKAKVDYMCLYNEGSLIFCLL